ncbi:MAG: trypsin-like peptidase domain-containing protein, partial [Candidatus Dormibacteraceae bacterium]
MAFRYLDDAMLREVQATAIKLGFAHDEQLIALNAGISEAFVARAGRGDSAHTRLLTLTAEMNTTRVLNSGEVPLIKWLNNAIIMAAEMPQETIFRRALEQASVDGLAPPAGSAGSGTSPARSQEQDVSALPMVNGGLEIQIGEDDTIGVGFLHAGSTAAQSVAKLLVHRYYDGAPSMLAGDEPEFGKGTGWMLAPRLLITNFHVINARMSLEMPCSPEDFKLQGSATHVLFDLYTSNSTPQATKSVSCVASDLALDYALLRLPEDAPARPPLRLRLSDIIKPKDRALRERVNVLQHPNGEPMRLGFRNNFVVSGTESKLSYLTDTAGGSSGSPICDDKWYVAALHNGFSTISGTPLTVWGKTVKQENYGTPIRRVIA